MNINKNNYEAWFLDYFENQLNAEQVTELFLFLEQHPSLKEEFDSFENTIIPSEFLEEENLLNKQSLKKYDVVCEKNINEWLIAQVEGELDAQQLQHLDYFLIEHPSYLRDQKLIAKTKLVQAKEEHFEQTSSLKQFSTITTGNIHSWLITELQGDLNLQERTALLAFLENHPEFNSDRALFQKTILSSVHEEEFPNKKKLRKGIVIPFYQQPAFYRVAALILLLMGAGIVFTIYQKNNSADRHMAEVKDSLISPSIITPDTHPAEKEKQYATVDTISKVTTTSPEKIKSSSDDLPKINQEQKHLAEQKSAPTSPKKSTQPVRDENKFVRQEEEFLAMDLKGTTTLPLDQPIISVERRYTPKATIAYENPNEPPSILEILQASRIANEVIDVTAKRINKVVGDELVSSPKNPIRLPFKSRILKFAANAISYISNNKVKVRTTFNPITGKMSAYEIQTNKKTIQRQFEAAKY
ncbi:MAG: hypothetical protein IPK10_07140 [Bacteroidetes bacterium]|nr:hypothetical protein [Bacteroidota bacterium]